MAPLHKNNKNIFGQKEAQHKYSRGASHHPIIWNRKLAAWMQLKTENISRKGKCMAFVLFCLLAGGISVLCALNGFSGKKAIPFSVGSIKTPYSDQHSGEKKSKGTFSTGDREYNRIHFFKMYMDSLKSSPSPSSQKLYDSIISARPTLIDSILIIENLYQSQTNK